jgi:hypothetical protein
VQSENAHHQEVVIDIVFNGFPGFENVTQKALNTAVNGYVPVVFVEDIDKTQNDDDMDNGVISGQVVKTVFCVNPARCFQVGKKDQDVGKQEFYYANDQDPFDNGS